MKKNSATTFYVVRKGAKLKYGVTIHSADKRHRLDKHSIYLELKLPFAYELECRIKDHYKDRSEWVECSKVCKFFSILSSELKRYEKVFVLKELQDEISAAILFCNNHGMINRIVSDIRKVEQIEIDKHHKQQVERDRKERMEKEEIENIVAPEGTKALSKEEHDKLIRELAGCYARAAVDRMIKESENEVEK